MPPLSIKLKCYLSLTLVASLILLTSCQTIATSPDACPRPVIADSCVTDWVAQLDGKAPQCVLGWMNQIEKQQRALQN